MERLVLLYNLVSRKYQNRSLIVVRTLQILKILLEINHFLTEILCFPSLKHFIDFGHNFPRVYLDIFASGVRAC